MSKSPSILISNLVYGEPYTDLFLNLHLPSLIENLRTNYFSDKSKYLVYTDRDSSKTIRSHPMFRLLGKFIDFEVLQIDGVALSYESRYGLQQVQVNDSACRALHGFDFFHSACADVVYGNNVLPDAARLLIQSGKNTICHTPMRVALESAAPLLRGPSAFSVENLFEVGLRHPHPLWTSSNLRTPYFTTIPYHMIWTNDSQVLLRGFAISPLLLKPSPWMTECGGSIDLSFSQFEQDFLWLSNWSDLPMLELGRLGAFYPCFRSEYFNLTSVVEWAKSAIPRSNWNNLLYWQYCKKPGSSPDLSLLQESNVVIDKMISELNAV